MFSSVATFAQHAVGSFNLQPKVGVNIANLTEIKDSDPRIGLAAGVEGEYQAGDIFSLSAGVLYSMQGAKQEFSVLNQTFKRTYKLDYINVPIMANVYVTAYSRLLWATSLTCKSLKRILYCFEETIWSPLFVCTFLFSLWVLCTFNLLLPFYLLYNKGMTLKLQTYS